MNELLDIISSLLLFLSTIFAKYFIFWFFTWLTVTEDWLESWFFKIDRISLLTTFDVLGFDDVSGGVDPDEEETGGGIKEFSDELAAAEEFGSEEFVVILEVGGEELDEEELGGSKELRREELDEEGELDTEGVEPMPCINESIVLSIIFPLPTLFKRLFTSVSMFAGLEALSDCE